MATRMSTSTCLATSPAILNTSSSSEAALLQVRLGLPLGALPNRNGLEFVALEFPHHACSLLASNREGKNLIERLSKNCHSAGRVRNHRRRWMRGCFDLKLPDNYPVLGIPSFGLSATFSLMEKANHYANFSLRFPSMGPDSFST